MRTAIVGLGLVALACSPNASSAGSGSGGRPAEGGDELDSGVTEGATSMAGTGLGDADGTGMVTAGDDPPAPGDGATMPPAETGDSDPTATTSGGEGMGEESSSGDPQPMQEVLSRANFAGCSDPLWCIIGSNPYNPVSNQQMWMQECFQATLPAPFLLRELQFDVGMTTPGIDDVRVQVYGYGGASGPGELIEERSFAALSLMNGINTVTLVPPIVVPNQAVCIGVAAPGLDGALGITVDESSLVNDVSFFQLDTPGMGCDTMGWTDVIDIDPTTEGNWCIRGTIETM
ncbi:MAG: hypothetical protein KC501_30930 [Myxococcales bacterium]|nr:hypothetical protein [Myxococcales bacterium]